MATEQATLPRRFGGHKLGILPDALLGHWKRSLDKMIHDGHDDDYGPVGADHHAASNLIIAELARRGHIEGKSPPAAPTGTTGHMQAAAAKYGRQPCCEPECYRGGCELPLSELYVGEAMPAGPQARARVIAARKGARQARENEKPVYYGPVYRGRKAATKTRPAGYANWSTYDGSYEDSVTPIA